MVLCRLWWNSWWTCSSSLTRSFLLPSRLSKCPSSSLSASRHEPRFVSRSWRNSWEVPTIVSFSSLQRVMEQTVDIPAPRGSGSRGGLQGFSQDRVQQLLPTLTFQFLVVIFKVSSQARVPLPHLLTLVLRMRLVKGFLYFSPG